MLFCPGHLFLLSSAVVIFLAFLWPIEAFFQVKKVTGKFCAPKLGKLALFGKEKITLGTGVHDLTSSLQDVTIFFKRTKFVQR